MKHPRMMWRRLFATLLVAAAGYCQAHELSANGAKKASSGGPVEFELPTLEGPTPWSDAPVLNADGRFQFAIVTDRTGGHRPGIWMDAVRKLNRLRPEFVVSVGDLIEGYTEDRDQVTKEWNEFLGFIDQLEMRFFFVAGNHDLTNPMMHEMWRQRFGPEWYSFDYQGVHFLCLNSEDPQQRIGDEQLDFIERDLKEHADARWTLVFLHKPLWSYAERQIAESGVDQTNWKRVENWLADRPHTVFAGHVHHYVQYVRNGREYYTLATTGGGSRLRGEPYGEFDHITWLTMEPAGPHVVNLRLDGILPADVVTEESAERFRNFLRSVRIEADPILVDDSQGFEAGELSVRLVNELGADVELEAEIHGLPLAGLTVEPDSFSMRISPVGSAERRVAIRFGESVSFDRLQRATMTARVRAETSDGVPALTAEHSLPIVIDRRHVCAAGDGPIAVDGVFDSPEGAVYDGASIAFVAEGSEDWQGPKDGSFAVACEHDDEKIVLKARVRDERVLPGRDRVAFLLDGRRPWDRLDDPRLRWGTTTLVAEAPGSEVPSDINVGPGWRRWVPDGVTGAGRLTDGGYEVEVAIPVERLERAQGSPWQSFQMCVVLLDADDDNRPRSEIVWRGTRDFRERNAGFARFVRGSEPTQD